MRVFSLCNTGILAAGNRTLLGRVLDFRLYAKHCTASNHIQIEQQALKELKVTKGKIDSVCVFCGSHSGTDPRIHADAVALGSALAARKMRLVYGGGGIGIMGMVADAVLAGGGEVTGVIPQALHLREVAHPDVADMRVVVSMHTRKAMMAELADAFVALPGGVGTIEELVEIATWAQLKFHSKPIVILNSSGYFDPLIQMFRKAVENGFMKESDVDKVRVVNTVEDLMILLGN